MFRTSNLLLVCCIFFTGCAFTLTAPIKPLKKNESKHSIYLPFGYQYQRGLGDSLEIGIDLSTSHLGGNLRYHLNKTATTLSSIQFGIGITGVKANYMYTLKTNKDSYFRISPNLCYQFDSAYYDNAIKSTHHTIRLGGSFTFSDRYLWVTLGFTYPIYKNYDNVGELGYSDGNPAQYGHPLFNPELKIGFSL